jgi:hypothetical protein
VTQSASLKVFSVNPRSITQKVEVGTGPDGPKTSISQLAPCAPGVKKARCAPLAGSVVVTVAVEVLTRGEAMWLEPQAPSNAMPATKQSA